LRIPTWWIWNCSTPVSIPSIHESSSSPLASFCSSSHLYITLSCATVCSRIHRIPSLGFGEGVVAREYNESWLVTSVINADACDCIPPMVGTMVNTFISMCIELYLPPAVWGRSSVLTLTTAELRWSPF
jgi:hypothetical protein